MSMEMHAADSLMCRMEEFADGLRAGPVLMGDQHSRLADLLLSAEALRQACADWFDRCDNPPSGVVAEAVVKSLPGEICTMPWDPEVRRFTVEELEYEPEWKSNDAFHNYNQKLLLVDSKAQYLLTIEPYPANRPPQ